MFRKDLQLFKEISDRNELNRRFLNKKTIFLPAPQFLNIMLKIRLRFS